MSPIKCIPEAVAKYINDNKLTKKDKIKLEEHIKDLMSNKKEQFDQKNNKLSKSIDNNLQ